jgi:hypothetical protein
LADGKGKEEDAWCKDGANKKARILCGGAASADETAARKVPPKSKQQLPRHCSRPATTCRQQFTYSDPTSLLVSCIFI